MFMTSRRAVGVDIGDSSVKAVEAERSGRTIRVVRSAVRSLPPGLSTSDPERMGKFIRDFFDDSGIRSTSAFFGVPRHQAVLRTIKIPSGDETQTQQMIRIQARKVLPVGGEGLKTGYILKETEGDRQAILVAAKKDVLEGISKSARAAGLKVSGITLSSFGTANAYLNAYPDGSPGVVVDIGGAMTEITLSCWGKFAASRQASIGSENLVKKLSEETGLSKSASSQAVKGARLGPGAPAGVLAWASELAGEIDRTLRAFAAEGLPVPERVLLTGGGAQVGDLAQFLSTAIGVRIEMFTPAAGVYGWPQQSGNEPGVLMVPALGYLHGGLAGTGTRFDFSRDFFAKADAKPPKSRKIIGAVAALAFVAAAWLIPDFYLDEMESEVSKRESTMTDVEKKHKERMTALESQRRDLRMWVGKRERWIDVLREITLSVPESKDVYLTSTNFKEGTESLKILGQAINEDAVNGFVNSLSRSAMFRRVERRMIIQHEERKERHKWDFEINAFLAESPEEVSK